MDVFTDILFDILVIEKYMKHTPQQLSLTPSYLERAASIAEWSEALQLLFFYLCILHIIIML